MTAPRRMTYSRAHPRSRGEHAPLFHRPFCIVGSSPLARGTRRERHRDRVPGGLIPARAGNTRPSSQARFQTRAHPRSRGEHMSGSSHWLLSSGSSPLTRRNTTRRSVVTRLPGAHPRSRGEHRKSKDYLAYEKGSSPPVRGARQDPLCGGALRGLIPACAGSTNREGVIVVIHGAHPRSRGEHWCGPEAADLDEGSSPLARGTRRHGQRRVFPVGLIPARAGNTADAQCREGREGAHPRSRGEHFCAAGPVAGLWGSSPLARGTLIGHIKARNDAGLIPARAGNTKEGRCA